MKKIDRAYFHLGILLTCLLLGSIVEYFVDFKHWSALYTIGFICPYIACLIMVCLTYWEPASLIPSWKGVGRGLLIVLGLPVALAKFDFEDLPFTVFLMAVILAGFIAVSAACLAFPLFTIFIMMGCTFSDSVGNHDYTLWPAKT